MDRGVVTFVNRRNGFGFIQSVEGEEELWFRLKKQTSIEKGANVSFEIQDIPVPHGKKRVAINVHQNCDSPPRESLKDERHGEPCAKHQRRNDKHQRRTHPRNAYSTVDEIPNDHKDLNTAQGVNRRGNLMMKTYFVGETIQAMLGEMLATKKPDEVLTLRVLDVGSGNSNALSEINAALKRLLEDIPFQIVYVGVEPEESRVRAARKYCGNLVRAGNIRAQWFTETAEAFVTSQWFHENRPYDLIIGLMMINYVEDRTALFNQLKTKLASHGSMVFTMCDVENFPKGDELSEEDDACVESQVKGVFQVRTVEDPAKYQFVCVGKGGLARVDSCEFRISRSEMEADIDNCSGLELCGGFTRHDNVRLLRESIHNSHSYAPMFDENPSAEVKRGYRALSLYFIFRIVHARTRT